MVAHAALAILAIIAVAGMGTAAATGAFSTASSGNFDLGTLVPNQAGNATATTTVHVTNTTYYKFEMEKEDRIGSAFSVFSVSVTVNGHTYNLTGDHNDSRILLNAGTYTFTVHLEYKVRGMVHSANESNVAFLYLHPTGNDTQDGSAGYVAADSTDSGSHNGSSRIVLASLTFQVQGNAGNPNDNGSSDSNNKDSILVTSA